MGWFTRKRTPEPPLLLVADHRSQPSHVAADQVLIDAIYQVADHVVVLHGLGFRRVYVRCERTAGRLRVAMVDVAAAAGGEAYRYTHDPVTRTALLSSACEALAEVLSARRRVWNGASMSVDRVGERLEVSCTGPDDALGALIAVQELVPCPTFLELVTRAGEGFEARQEAVRERFGGTPWEFDKATSTLTFGGTDHVRATLLGSYAREMQSWLWAWANPSLRPLDTTMLRATCAQLGGRGMRLFSSPGVPCDEGFAWSIAMAAANACGTPSLYLAPTGSTLLFFAADF